jgi:hypothetical protein
MLSFQVMVHAEKLALALSEWQRLSRNSSVRVTDVFQNGFHERPPMVVESCRMKKRRKKKIDKGKEARRAARNSGIAPAATRVIPDKRKRAPKHKKELLETELE